VKRSIGLLAFGLLWSARATAYPEFVRHGYFSCTSCHVSPGGGGALTDYGRSFAAERLTTWVAKVEAPERGEERFLHGAAPALPTWLVLGGNFRQIQTVTESSRSRDGRWIPMQRDVEACLVGGSTWTCATVGVTRPATTTDDGKARYGMRRVSLRVDVAESLVLRAGRFAPRYGLMIANHTSPVRQGLGLDQDSDEDQLEATWMSELFEIALARGFGRPLELAVPDDPSKDVTAHTLTGALALRETTRVGLSYRRTREADVTTHTAGFFVASELGEPAFLLAEVDQRAIVRDDAAVGTHISRSVMSHARLGYEAHRGVLPYLLHEVAFKDITDGATRSDTYGYGVQWYPRPHFELDVLSGHVLSRATNTYASVAYLLIHYHL
jgi:hypothetical protein